MKHAGIFPVLLFATMTVAEAVDLDSVRNMSPNTWLTVPGSRLVDSPSVASPSEFPYLVRSTSSIRNITDFGGATFDTKRNRLVLMGGGHNSYDGNEVYAFDLNKMSWDRLTDPSVPRLCTDTNADQTPAARHTYNGLAYIAHTDQFFVMGGAVACNGGGCGGSVPWAFDFGSSKWQRFPQGDIHPRTFCENLAAYDPNSKKLFWFDGHTSRSNGLWSLDFNTREWKKHNNDLINARTATVDTKRKLLVVVGKGEVLAYDIANGNPVKEVWQTTGGNALISIGKPGLAYDPTTDRIVGWGGSETNGAVYSLNPETKVWTVQQASGSPSTDRSVGIYGLWQYVPAVNAFIVMPHAQEEISFYKFGPGTGTGSDSVAPAPPTELRSN